MYIYDKEPVSEGYMRDKVEYWLELSEYDLEPLNIEARYPSYKDKLLAALTRSRCEELLIKTKQFIEWIKKRL